MKKLIDKKLTKKVEGKCRICKVDIYEVLHVHRITPGRESGRYTKDNTLVCCSNCHNRIHAGQIIVDKWYMSTDGRKIRVIIDGEEQFL